MVSRLFLSCFTFIYCFNHWMSRTTTASSVIPFDDSLGLGRLFDGIGGLSAGASSKLLANYPVQQRDDILDYLFKPNFGASLQILKVEIGGDSQSTDGTESSHMHNSWEENYSRGYEWWLMKEAKQRNPAIKLYGLPWGFPGWVGQGKESPWVSPNITAGYIVRWIAGAKSYHNLTIDYIGIWNERRYDKSYVKILRELLDKEGFMKVVIVVGDDVNWNVANDVEADVALASVVDILGVHYPGTKSTETAVKTGKPLWSSEDYSSNCDERGAGCWARILNQNYVNGLMTSTISWALISSWYKDLPYFGAGLMIAAQPWSGYYEVDTPIWISAHTTQFTAPGWKYLAHGSGVGLLEKGGSYVGLTSPENKQLTIVIETMSHDHSECIRPPLPKYNVKSQKVYINLKGSFAPISQMNVWYSKLGFNATQTVMFEKKAPLTFKNGVGHLDLGVDEVWTLTTLTSGQKGSHGQPPNSMPFPLPYKDNFEGYTLHQEPYNLAQQLGAFEVLGTSQNHFMRQMVEATPVEWCRAEGLGKAYTIIGDESWSDICIEIGFSIPAVNGTDGVFVAVRADVAGCTIGSSLGIFLFILEDKFVLSNDLKRSSVLMQGTLSYQAGWHKISLLAQNQTAVGAFDGKGLFNITIPTTPGQGRAAIGTDSFGLADFDNLTITTAAEGQGKMSSYFQATPSQSLYFESELHDHL